jgi:hypothetical protein
MKPIPDAIKEYLSYDKDTGLLTWIKSPNRRHSAGSTAGTIVSGYVYVGFNHTRYAAHRIAWFLHYGDDPEQFIDHINRNRTDNRIDNLRLSTGSQNQHNKQAFGASYDIRQKHWRSSIQIGGRQILIGTYPCPLLAGVDYLAVKSILHPRS